MLRLRRMQVRSWWNVFGGESGLRERRLARFLTLAKRERTLRNFIASQVFAPTRVTFLALMFVMLLSGSAPATAGDGDQGAKPKLDKLKMASFPAYKAKILLPVQYQKRDERGQLTAMGADLPHGIYMFISMTVGDNERLTLDTIKPILKGTLQAMKAECSEEQTLKLNQYEGLQCSGKVKIDADVEAVVRGYIVGQKLYFVSAMGTGVWMKSKDVRRYMESFEIVQ